MNAIFLFRLGLLPTLAAGIMLAASHAKADPISTSQFTVNSIEFSFMDYGNIVPSEQGGLPAEVPPSPDLPPIVPTPQELTAGPAGVTGPTGGPGGPGGPNGPAGTAEIQVPAQQEGEVPEPGTLAMLGLGMAALASRRRI